MQTDYGKDCFLTQRHYPKPNPWMNSTHPINLCACLMHLYRMLMYKKDSTFHNELKWWLDTNRYDWWKGSGFPYSIHVSWKKPRHLPIFLILGFVCFNGTFQLSFIPIIPSVTISSCMIHIWIFISHSYSQTCICILIIHAGQSASGPKISRGSNGRRPRRGWLSGGVSPRNWEWVLGRGCARTPEHYSF